MALKLLTILGPRSSVSSHKVSNVVCQFAAFDFESLDEGVDI